MNFLKIKSSIAPFDELFEGFYVSQPSLLSGKRGTGTSTIALRFLSHLIRIGEKVLLFTDQPPAHVTLAAHGLGADLAPAVESEQLSIIPYDEQLPLLPFPEALDELRTLIAERHYTFVVFDPAMPWLAAPADQLSARLDAFFSLLSDTEATALLILHQPVSKLARRLFEEVSERCAICLAVTRSHEGSHTLQVTKYMGEPPEKCPATIHLSSSAPTPPPTFSPRASMTATQIINVMAPPAHTPPRSSPRFATSASASFFPGVPATRPAPAPRPAPAAPRPAHPAPPAASAASAFGAAMPTPAPARAPTAPAATTISLANILPEDSAFFSAPLPRNPRNINFSDARPDAPRPQRAAPGGTQLVASARPPAPPPPPPPRAPQPPPTDSQNRQGHAIRFSDIIQ